MMPSLLLLLGLILAGPSPHAPPVKPGPRLTRGGRPRPVDQPKALRTSHANGTPRVVKGMVWTYSGGRPLTGSNNSVLAALEPTAAGWRFSTHSGVDAQVQFVAMRKGRTRVAADGVVGIVSEHRNLHATRGPDGDMPRRLHHSLADWPLNAHEVSIGLKADDGRYVHLFQLTGPATRSFSLHLTPEGASREAPRHYRFTTHADAVR